MKRRLGFAAIVIVRVIGIFCALTLFTLFVANITYIRFAQYRAAHTECNYADGKYLSPGRPWNLFEQTITETGTYWTAIASLVGILALWGINEQIVGSRKANDAANRSAKAAEDANAETKRSVNVSIRSERGRLGFNAMARTHGSINVLLENIGSTPLFLIQLRLKVQWAPEKGQLNFHNFDVIDSMYFPVRAGSLVSTYQDAKVPVISVQDDGLMGTSNNLLIG